MIIATWAPSYFVFLLSKYFDAYDEFQHFVDWFCLLHNLVSCCLYNFVLFTIHNSLQLVIAIIHKMHLQHKGKDLVLFRSCFLFFFFFGVAWYSYVNFFNRDQDSLMKKEKKNLVETEYHWLGYLTLFETLEIKYVLEH